MFHNVVLFCIISQKKIRIDFQHLFPYCMLNFLWYNATICSQLPGFSLEYYGTNARRNRSNIISSIEDHGRNILINRQWCYKCLEHHFHHNICITKLRSLSSYFLYLHGFLSRQFSVLEQYCSFYRT